MIAQWLNTILGQIYMYRRSFYTAEKTLMLGVTSISWRHYAIGLSPVYMNCIIFCYNICGWWWAGPGANVLVGVLAWQYGHRCMACLLCAGAVSEDVGELYTLMIIHEYEIHICNILWYTRYELHDMFTITYVYAIRYDYITHIMHGHTGWRARLDTRSHRQTCIACN